jgi:VCBS repeat-containing protein
MSDESSKKSFTKALASAKTDVIKSSLMLIDALAGNDRITGDTLAQTIYGGSGNDMLQGAGGNDTLWGDGSSTAAGFVAGRDTFVFEKTLAANGVDTVMDFCIAGHKKAGVLQAGSFVADTLDLSRIKFTGPASLASNDDGDDHDGNYEEDDKGDDSDEGDDDFHITAANVNDYVTIKGGELYIDIDGLGAGQAQVWAHLNGVSGGDLVNLKLDDFTGRIEAKNALATITGNSSGAVTEDGTLLASGTLSVADTDRAENVFKAASANDLLGAYGSFVFNQTSGAWSFALDNAAAQQMQTGESGEQQLTVTSLDGSATQTIKVTVQGAQDVAVISGLATSSVTEDGALSANETMSVNDADHDQNSFQAASSAALKGSYGDFSFNQATGEWSFLLDNAAAQTLRSDTSINEVLTVTSLDGTATRVITVTVNGSADRVSAPPVFTGTGDSTDKVTAQQRLTFQGEGNDILVGTAADDTLIGDSGNDVIIGLGGNDRVNAGPDNDIVFGGEGNDTLNGRLGNDRLYGGSGNDYISSGKSLVSSGGVGADILIGGFGADVLVGGTNLEAPNNSLDIFKFVDIKDTGNTLYFVDASLEQLDFSVIDADINTAGNQGFTLTQSLEIQAKGINWFFEGYNTIVQFDNDGNTGEADADFEITLVGNITLTAANFVL